MRVLLIISGNTQNVFVKEQAAALSELGVAVQFFFIKGKGALGYLSSLNELKKVILFLRPEIVHAHYGLSGVLANLQRTVPVITTYHGCDINRLALRWWSFVPLVFSSKNIFVSQAMQQKVHWVKKKSHCVVPMGVNTHIFYEIDQKKARKQLNLDPDKTYLLFSSDFSIPVKNYELAAAAIDIMKEDVELLELKGYSREQVNLLMNACDAGLLTSVREGSPMFIKELMCVNRQIVSTDVGDVRTVCGEIPGCYVTGFDPGDIAEKITAALRHSRTEGRTKGRERIFQLGFDGRTIAKKVLQIYRQVAPKG